MSATNDQRPDASDRHRDVRLSGLKEMVWRDQQALDTDRIRDGGDACIQPLGFSDPSATRITCGPKIDPSPPIN